MFFLLLAPITLIVLFIIVSNRPTKLNLTGAHILVTGGSSGIGLEVAKECARRGGFITIAARNEGKLKEAKAEVDKELKGGGGRQCCTILPLDVSQSYDEIEKQIKSAEDKLGPVDVLVNSAGVSHGEAFDETPVGKFEWLMKVNYLGSVYCTKAVLPGMKQRKKGRIVYVSSQAGQTGVFGYSGYSATKFALRGLAETLQMEVKPYNIAVTVSYPPDTDTPGFHLEDETKPEETRLISETSGLFTAEKVGKGIVEDLVKGEFTNTVGLNGFILGQLSAAMAPCNSTLNAFLQVLLMSPLRIVALGYLKSFDRIVERCAAKREEQAEPKSE